MAKGVPGKKGVKKGVNDVLTILNGYDTFHWSRETLARVADIMILLAVFTLAAVLWNRSLIAGGSLAGFQEVDLSLVLFGLSACIFAVFRAVLFMIEDYREKAVGGVQGIGNGQFSGGRRNLLRAVESVTSRLQDSITLWWTARVIVIRAVFVIIPGVLFYLLGIANLVMYVIGKGMHPGV